MGVPVRAGSHPSVPPGVHTSRRQDVIPECGCSLAGWYCCALHGQGGASPDRVCRRHHGIHLPGAGSLAGRAGGRLACQGAPPWQLAWLAGRWCPLTQPDVCCRARQCCGQRPGRAVPLSFCSCWAGSQSAGSWGLGGSQASAGPGMVAGWGVCVHDLTFSARREGAQCSLLLQEIVQADGRPLLAAAVCAAQAWLQNGWASACHGLTGPSWG